MPALSKKPWLVWIVLCVVSGGAVWAWQSGWLVEHVPQAAKVLTELGLPLPDRERINSAPDSTPEDVPAEFGAQQEPAIANTATPVESSRTTNPFAREPRPVTQPARAVRVIPTAFQEPAAQPIEEPPVVAAKERPTVAPVKTSPGSARVSSPAPLDDLAGKGTQLLDDAKIEQLIQLGDYLTAQRELSKWYWRTPARRDELRPKLDELAKALYFSPQPLFREPYVVQSGDQLRVIAQRYKMTWEYLAKLNRTDPKKIRVGQKLKVVEGPFSALVILTNYELIVHLNGSFVKSYRIGAGKDGVTPVGTFPVKNKLTDPTYYGPDGVIAHDNPKNPLGERWIDIGDSYGIHGTIEPDTIGKNESRGCIRLLNADVEEVYDFLVVGSEVKIQR